jgi:hypothetical protein
VITIQEKVIKGACISYGRIDKMEEEIVVDKPGQRGPL